MDHAGNAGGKCREPKYRRGILLLLLLIHTVLLAWVAFRNSPTLNEPGHLVSGLAHWNFARFEPYSVNPPLVRLIAAMPVLASEHQTDWRNIHSGRRPEFSMGTDFVAANGHRTFWLTTIARWVCIPLSLMGLFVCYCWAFELFGGRAAVMAALLWCFSPNIVGHASLLTCDAHSASIGIAVWYLFWRWLRVFSWGRTISCGIMLGLAVCAKATLVVFYPLIPLVWCCLQLSVPKSDRSVGIGRQFVQGIVLIGVSIYVVNSVYCYDGTFKELGDFHFTSKTLTKAASGASPGNVNVFRGTWLERIPVPFPADFVQGIDLQKRDFENFAAPSYLRGTFQSAGWWYYYIYAALVKIPLGTLALVVIFTLTGRLFRLPLPVSLTVTAPAVTVACVVSANFGFSHHFRYVIPALPFMFVGISQLARNNVVPSAVTGVLIVWSLISSLWVYPHSLSYFNELAGGPINGRQHLINSNIDWGQDLGYLHRWSRKNDAVLHLAYYGLFDPAETGFSSARPIPTPDTFDCLPTGWYAISVNLLQGYPWGAKDGRTDGNDAADEKELQRVLAWLRGRKPTTYCGYSIYIYHVQ